MLEIVIVKYSHGNKEFILMLRAITFRGVLKGFLAPNIVPSMVGW